MNATRRGLIIALLLFSLGFGLHASLTKLSGELPQIFPDVAREDRILPPPPETKLEEDIPPPQNAVPIKRSQEVFENAVQASTESLKPVAGLASKRPLIHGSRLPELSGLTRGVSERFPVPAVLVPAVDFWKKIYGVYSSRQVVIHDMDHLEVEYGVLDFDEAGKKVSRTAEINAQTAKIRAALSELNAWDGHSPVSNEAQRIAVLFQNVSDPLKYKKAKDAIRTQTGMKDRFLAGIRRSGRYLPTFERIFQQYGVPREITRLVFVESTFFEKAFSKVGAAGLWQFMPETGKNYMTVTRQVDERYDPILATHGAAQLLLKNYALLGTWPLAINAYNSGGGNLLKAIAAHGTRDIGTIIKNYRSGSYAFASRNFFPSFLAALDVYENADRFFGSIKKDVPLNFDVVTLPTTMSFPEIAVFSEASLDQLKELNPAYAPEVFEGKFSLASGTQIRLPQGRQAFFAARWVRNSFPSPALPPVSEPSAAPLALSLPTP